MGDIADDAIPTDDDERDVVIVESFETAWKQEG
jgi:hypothetical protein